MTISNAKLIIAVSFILLLSACGSTSPQSKLKAETNRTFNAGNSDSGDASLEDMLLLQKTVGQLQTYNLEPGRWNDIISAYANQNSDGANSTYNNESAKLHNKESSQRCDRSSIIAIANALANHPSSIPVLSYALACAERLALSEQQVVIAQSIGIVSEQLVNETGNGSNRSTPLFVRELYEGAYLLDLAGIEVFETEMLVESERILILHHGIDQITNRYSLSFADQSSFFIQSISASMHAATNNLSTEAKLETSVMIELKRKALQDAKHYSMQLWDLRQQLFAGDYQQIIEQLSKQNRRSPIAVSMLAHAYIATENMSGLKSIEDDIIRYAELGIPESQSVAAMMLLKMKEPNGTSYRKTRSWDDTDSDVNQDADVTLVLQSFEQSVKFIGIENASLLWVRSFMGDPSVASYLPLIAEQLDTETLSAWQASVTYIAKSLDQRNIELNKRVNQFNRILNSASTNHIASSKGSLQI